jgi:hypothetical protein
MTIRTRLLCGAAAALFSLAPAIADETNYRQNPTPAERAATDDLNRDAGDRARGDTDANVAAQGDYDASRAAYERSLNDYRDRQSNYDNDRARYDAERNNYDRERSLRWSAFRDTGRYHDVYSLHSTELVGLTVRTRAGERIGRIRDVDYTANGRVRRIAIEIRGHRSAWIYADDVRYDPQGRVILIDLSNDQVDRLSRMRNYGI